MEYLTENVSLKEKRYEVGIMPQELPRDLSNVGLHQKVRYELSPAEKDRLVGKLQCDSTECWAGACQ